MRMRAPARPRAKLYLEPPAVDSHQIATGGGCLDELMLVEGPRLHDHRSACREVQIDEFKFHEIPADGVDEGGRGIREPRSARLGVIATHHGVLQPQW